MARPNWFKWGWYFTLTVESGVVYPSKDVNWDVVESDFLLPTDRLYGGGVGIIQFTSQNFELLERIVSNGYDMSNFPNGVIKSDLVNGQKTIDWFKSSASPEGGLFNVAETIEIKKMLKSEQGLESQAHFNDIYFFTNNKSAMDNIENSSLSDEIKAYLVNIVVLRPASVSVIINGNPSTLNEAVALTLNIPQLSGYGNRMNAVADGLASVDLNDTPPIDFDNINGGGSPDPDPEDPWDFNKVINQVVTIVETGRDDLEAGYNVNTDGIKESLLNGLKSIYKPPLFKNSADFITNALFKITKTYENMLKINPTTKMDDVLNTIIDEALENLTVELDIDSVFDSMISQIRAIPKPDGSEPEPEPSEERYFPVNVNDTGVNFWAPPHSSSITEDMDFGYRTNGDFHAGYDVGAGGNTNIKVYAVTGGTVSFAGDDGTGWGTRVVIKHSSDNYHSLYAHLKTGSLTVSTGDTVKAGQQIGVMGNSGGNYAIHLHYELSESGTFDDGNTIDPKPYLKVVGNNQTELPNPV